MRNKKKFLLIAVLIASGNTQTKWEIVSSNKNELVINLQTAIKSSEDLKPIELLIGLPDSSLPQIKIQGFNKNYHSMKIDKLIVNTGWIHSQTVNGLNTATLRISPSIDSNSYYESMVITIPISGLETQLKSINKIHELLLSPKIVNWDVAKNWIQVSKRKLLKEDKIPDGIWVKFYLSNDGVYKISGKELKSTIETNLIFDPRSIMLFTSSSFGRDRTYDLTQNNSTKSSIPTNLVELPITINGESDGNLSDNDHIIFYGKGPNGFQKINQKIEWHQNLYFIESTYWILIPSNSSLRGKRIETANLNPEAPEKINYGQFYQHFETDLINPHSSGLSWGEKTIQQGASYSIELELSNLIKSFPVEGKFGMIGKEKVQTKYNNTKHEVSISSNNQELARIDWSNLGHKSKKFSLSSNLISTDNQTFTINNESENPNSEPLIDYITINYYKELSYSQPFEFYSKINKNDGTFIIKGSNLLVWNTTNVSKPINMPLNTFGNNISTNFSFTPGTIQKFSVFNINDIKSISNLLLIGSKKWDLLRSNSNGAKHIILGPSEFRIQSQALIDHRQNTIYAPIETIYDEFSGGNKDPIAIRHFLSWTQNYWSQKPYTVLFMGDADYDYRNITGKSNIKVPTIEVGTIYSHSTDDRLVSFNGTIPEMATGRFPARTNNEINNFISSLIEFETKMPNGLWRQKITLVADDPARPERESYELSIGKSHTRNSEKLAKLIPNFIDINKIYMIDYPEVNDGSTFGITKPEATQALFSQISSGTAIINFIGHGNPTQWAQEKLLLINQDRNDIELMDARLKLPLWIAGTCNWGRFDDINQESFAEELIRSSNQAASGIITTTRGITVSSNIDYLERIFREVFNGDSLTFKSIGSVLQSVKTGGVDGELFHFFGDPAMIISIPNKIINNGKVSPDTLATLSIGTLSAESPFSSGEGYLLLEEGETEIKKIFNFASKQEEITYLKKGATLFRGSFTYSNKTISPQFRVPKDIKFSDNPSKIRFNVNDGNNSVAIGAVSNVRLAFGPPSNDTEGPIIRFETKTGRTLRSGDHINKSETIVVRLSDPLGINLTGEKGHELTLIDKLTKTQTNMISKFIYDINSISTGSFIYNKTSDFNEVSIQINAWDNANNPSESIISLGILNSKSLNLLNVLNFPNPFSINTQFSFELTIDAEVSINIYTLEGRKIKTINSELYYLGYNKIYWDGKDEYGNLPANGVYLYKIVASNDNQKVNHIGRLAIFR